jgi:exonuclease III
MGTNIKFITLNARGIMDNTKRKKLIKYIKPKSPAIISLQETNTRNNQDFIHRQSGANESIWTPHTALLLYSQDYTMHKLQEIEDRAIIIDLKPKNEQDDDIPTLRVISIYAPANRTNRPSFYSNLLNNPFLQNSESPIILMGDLNFDFQKPEGLKPYGQILQSNYLCLHPDVPTWHSANSHSRLDYILISKELRPYAYRPTVKQTPDHLTDHCKLSLTLDFNIEPRGPGQWILNNSILKDEPFINLIKEVLSKAFVLNGPFHKIPIKDLTTEHYELLKQALRETCIAYSKEKAKSANQQCKEWQEELKSLTADAHRQRVTESSEDRIKTLEKLFDEHEKKKINGQIIRSRVRWREEGEKSSGYFYKTLRIHQSNSYIKSFYHPETREASKSTKETLKAAHCYYKTLFNPTPITPDNTKLLENIPSNLINQDDAFSLIKEIKKEELLEAIDQSPYNKAPGLDGLSFEFYRTFSNTVLTEIMLYQFNNALLFGVIPPSWNQTKTTLFYKKGDRLDLKNWRPIALINTDSKILSRILTNRMSKILPNCIAEHQTGFIKSRYIGDNAATALFAMAHFNSNKSYRDPSPVIVLMDQEKAYDRIHPDWLDQVLTRFGFPRRLITIIKSMFFNSTTRIMINGHLTDPVPQKRGLRQGDALSPLLFNLMIEPFLRSINNSIPGYRFNEKISIKYLAYADDIAIFINKDYELNRLLELYEVYASASNSKLNVDKTEVVTLSGPCEDWKPKFPTFKWYDSDSETCPRYLGYPLSLRSKHQNQFVEKIIAKMSESITQLKTRNLSMIGKALVMNSLVTSKLWHLIRIVPLNKDHIQRIHGMMRSYLWESGRASLAWDVVCLPRKLGGLGVISAEHQGKALLIRHITPLIYRYHFNRSFVHNIMEFLLRSITGSESHLIPIFYPELYIEQLKGFPLLPNLLSLCQLFKYSKKIFNLWPKDFMSLPIAAAIAPLKKLNNKTAGLPLSKVLWSWPPTSLVIKDSLDSILNPDPTIRSLLNKLDKKKVIWIGPMRFTKGSEDKALRNRGSFPLIAFMKTATINGLRLPDLRPKVIRRRLNPRAKTVNQDLPEGFWFFFWNTGMENKDKIIWWKLIHNRIPTRKWLHKIYPEKCESEICEICKTEIEDTEHFFFKCPIKKKIWDYGIRLMNIWAPKYGVEHKFDLVEFKNIQQGFADKYLDPSKYEKVKPMIVFGIILRNIWNAHWAHVREGADREEFNYNHVSSSIKSQLIDRIFEDLAMKIKIYRWLKPGVVELKGSLIQINLPPVEI